MSGVYEYGAMVTELDCEAIDVTSPGSKFREYVAGRYTFRVGELNVPVLFRDDLPPVGTNVRVVITWGEA